MKHTLNSLAVVFVALASSLSAQGQGTFVFDQQSSDEGVFFPGGAYINSVANPAQSFTPSLNAVQFIRLYIEDGNAQDGLGASLVVNLRSNSFNGIVLGTSGPLVLQNGFVGPVSFVFSNSIAVTSGVSYFFDIIRIAGNDTFTANISVYNYNAGVFFLGGALDTQNRDMWFREGIIVPEPSTMALVLLSGGVFSRLYNKRKSRE